ncbi:hypothetical protein E2C01_015438 [Portunus trituberculatus]|uniref:Uncharacterized protein n=1 Tax=Portunus trituberculatus TaxID=210409 RepID=A0A5B7DN21_PORTR|nr:hypothetical protein [Portunus trituberculatus]
MLVITSLIPGAVTSLDLNTVLDPERHRKEDEANKDLPPSASIFSVLVTKDEEDEEDKLKCFGIVKGGGGGGGDGGGGGGSVS